MFYSDFTARVGISPCIFCTEQIVFERKLQKKITNLNLKISLLDQCGWNFICIEILTEATNENIYTSQKKRNSWKRWDQLLLNDELFWLTRKVVCNLSFGTTQMNQISCKPAVRFCYASCKDSVLVLAVDQEKMWSS